MVRWSVNTEYSNLMKKYTLILLCLLTSFIYPQRDYNFDNYGLSMSVSFPKTLMGLSIFNDVKDSWYVNGKIHISPIDSRDEFYDYSTKWSEVLGDTKKDEKIDYTILNGGFTKILKNKSILFFGIGMVIWDEYYQYYDEYHILGDDGMYWVNGDEKGKSINLNGGIIIPIKSDTNKYFNYFHLDFDLNPPQLSVGVGW